LVISLIGAWIAPFSLNLSRPGLSQKCEKGFQQFGLLSFLDGLLNLCDKHGITHSICSIADLIIEIDSKLFMMCLLNLPHSNERRVQSAKSLLLYVFHKSQDDFLEVCHQYLSMTACSSTK
jgi:hypothetical protein